MELDFEILPTMDIVFQYIFSSEGSENGLLGFLNAIQESMNQPLATSVEIQNPFNLQAFLEDKQTVVDLKARDSSGRVYDVEMQTVNKKAFPNRVVYYASQLYTSQLKEGMDYSALNQVISIALMSFELFPTVPELHNVFELRNIRDSKIRLTDILQFHTLELTERKWQYYLTRLKEETSEGRQDLHLHNWVDFLLNANQKTEAEMENMVLRTPGLDTTYEKFRIFTSDDQLREQMRLRRKAEMDHRAEIEYGKEEGRIEGRIEERKAALHRILQLRFGEQVSEEIFYKISQMTDGNRLQKYFDEATCAKTLEEFVENL